MRLLSVFFMAGDGTASSPRRLTTIWPVFDQWAILVRDAFTCRDRNGNLLPERVERMPKTWTLVRDMGALGVGAFDLDGDVETEALAKFGTGTSVVGTTLTELLGRAIVRRDELLTSLPNQARNAFAQPDWKSVVREWLVGLNPSSQVLQQYRTWLVQHLDGEVTTCVPPFMLRRARTASGDGELRWSAVADFADFLDGTSGPNLLVARVTGVLFLQLAIEALEGEVE